MDKFSTAQIYKKFYYPNNFGIFFYIFLKKNHTTQNNIDKQRFTQNKFNYNIVTQTHFMCNNHQKMLINRLFKSLFTQIIHLKIIYACCETKS